MRQKLILRLNPNLGLNGVSPALSRSRRIRCGLVFMTPNLASSGPELAVFSEVFPLRI